MAAPAECSVQVFCRVRPMNSKEVDAKEKFLPKFPADDQISLAGKVYVFDKVFQPNSSQEQVYSGAAYHIVQDGVFGETDLQGIIPRIVEDIFAHINKMDIKLEFQLKVSYYEIYNERVRDLLDVTKVNLAIHEDKNRVPYVKGATEQSVASPQEIMDLIEQGKRNRQVAVTNMNEHSSRSHSVFLISVQQRHLETNKMKNGKLYLVDLAGNSRTTVIICASPAEYNEAETKSTLQFGARAKTIKNVVAINEMLSADEWKRRYEKERDKNARLKALLAAAKMELDRWRNGDKVPEGEWVNFDEPGTAIPGMANSMATTDSSMEQSILAPAPLIATAGPITDEEKKTYEEERAKLYQQLDEKDDEIQNLWGQIEQSRVHIEDLEEQVTILRDERELSMAENQAMLRTNEASKEETKEVLTALEELALNFDAKTQEVEAKSRELEQISEDLARRCSELDEIRNEHDSLKEAMEGQRRKIKDYVGNMLKELQDADVQLKMPAGDEDEVLAFARIHISKLASDFRAAKEKYTSLESGSEGVDQKLKGLETELDEVKIHMAQVEAKNKSQQETLDKLEKEKRDLQTEIDQLSVRLSSSSTAGEGGDSAEHGKLIGQLRDEIAEKNKRVDTLNSTVKELEAMQEQLKQEMERLRTEEGEKDKKIKELSDKKEQASMDMRGLQETVDKELSALNNLRRQFVADIAARIKRSSGPDSVEDEFGGSPAQKQRISFLESNLDKLTKVHKQLVKDNADLRLELPKLEKKLRTTTERVKSLEQFATACWTRRLNDLTPAEVERLWTSSAVLYATARRRSPCHLDELDDVPPPDPVAEAEERLRLDGNQDFEHELSTETLSFAQRVSQRRVFSQAMTQALRDAKESAMRDRKKYQTEVERIKEAVRQRNLARRGLQPQIVKTIRPGQVYATPAAAPIDVMKSSQELSRNGRSFVDEARGCAFKALVGPAALHFELPTDPRSPPTASASEMCSRALAASLAILVLIFQMATAEYGSGVEEQLIYAKKGRPQGPLRFGKRKGPSGPLRFGKRNGLSATLQDYDNLPDWAFLYP